MIECRGERCFLTGDLTHDQVSALLDEDAAFLDKGAMIIDLAGVQAIDSSAISLMLEWTRRATARNAKVSFANLGPALSSLMDLYGVSDVIPVASQ
jgi:phospholipid transport system transporter-binding protein